MVCYVRILGSLIFNIFLLTYDDFLYHECRLCVYVLPQDGPRRPKFVGEITVTKQNFMYEYVQLVGINTV